MLREYNTYSGGGEYINLIFFDLYFTHHLCEHISFLIFADTIYIILISMKLIFSHSFSPSFNLAAEEYLFTQMNDNYLLLYVNEPSIIIGSNQAVVNEVDMDFCIDNDIRIFRRMSGGGAVYHDLGNINYTFIGEHTRNALGADFLTPIVEVLNIKMGIPVSVGKRKDLWLDGFKISGTAAHISRGRQLHHGTLLYDANVDNLLKALSPENRNSVQKATASVPSPVKNIRQYLLDNKGAAPYKDDFFDLFSLRMLEYYELDELTALLNSEIEEITALQQEKYIQRSWNYRK